MSGTVKADEMAILTKCCTKCGFEKPFSAFFHRKAVPSGFGSHCKECDGARVRKKYLRKKPISTTESRKRDVTKAQRWRHRHPEKAAQSNRRAKAKRVEKDKVLGRIWVEKNREKVRLYVRMANARRRSNGMRNPIELVERLMLLQRHKCAVCRCDITKKFNLDHIKPLSRGGENLPRNIQLLCQPCNNFKYAKDPIDFMRSLGRLL